MVLSTPARPLRAARRVADELHLRPTGIDHRRYADNRTAQRVIVGDVWLELAGRASVFSTVIEPDRETALIGAIVLEELDLIADCTTQCVHPAEPARNDYGDRMSTSPHTAPVPLIDLPSAG